MRKKGFTLIELLVVISIIGLLAALIVVNFNAARERARDVQRKSDLDQVKKALRMYYNDNNFYPTDDVQKSEGQDFCLWATLENKSDTDIAKSQARCSDCSVGEDDYVVCAD